MQITHSQRGTEKKAIHAELRDHLSRNYVKAYASHQSRNTSMILYFYGFGDSRWPTLEETAQTWGIGTRERVRQIKRDIFLRSLDQATLPSLQAFIKLLDRSRYWRRSELVRELTNAGLVDDQFSIRGLLNLVDDLKLDASYDIVTADLDRVTRYNIDGLKEYFIVRKEDLRRVRSIYQKARRAAHRRGLSRLSRVAGDLDVSEDLRTMLESMIRFSDSAWLEEADGDVWYVFEDRDNVFFNNTAKVFSVIDSCSAMELAETYLRTLGRYTHTYDLPSPATVARYLSSSSMFSSDGGVLTHIAGSTREISGIERDLVDLLTPSSEGVAYKYIRKALTSRGHSGHHVRQTIAFSPFLSVDTTHGRTQYKYFLVGRRMPASTLHKEGADGRYQKFSEKLRDVRFTDATAAVEQRPEQRILRDWLFENKEDERCAICGKRFRVDALVAAHKKKRADCNGVEKRDPRIVMPACVFGCDYVYERRHVVVRDGIIARGTVATSDDAVEDYVVRLLGREVVHEWRKGPQYYFTTDTNE